MRKRVWTRRGDAALCVALCGLGFLLRLWAHDGGPFWYDELQSVTFAGLEEVVDVLRAGWKEDPHPPLYYLGLHYWMRVSATESWIVASSMLLGVGLIASTYYVVLRLAGRPSAVWAASYAAILPWAVWYSHEARMYALLMLAALWGSYFCHRALTSERPVAAAIGFGAASLCVLYSHGGGFLYLIAVSGWGFVLVAFRRTTRTGVLAMVIAAICVGAAYAPWLERAAEIELAHLESANSELVGEILWSWAVGTALAPEWGTMLILLLAGAFALVTAVLDRSGTSAAAVAALALGVGAAVAISAWVRPFLHVRTLIVLLPIFAIVLGITAQGPGHRCCPKIVRLRQAVAFLVAGLLAFGCFHHVEEHEKPATEHAAARALERMSYRGATIYVTKAPVGWGLCWYLAGPGQARARWRGTLCNRGGTRVVVGRKAARRGRRYFVVARHRASIRRKERRKAVETVAGGWQVTEVVKR